MVKAVSVHLQLVSANDVRETIGFEKTTKSLLRKVVSRTAAQVLSKTGVVGSVVKLTHLSVLFVRDRVRPEDLVGS